MLPCSSSTITMSEAITLSDVEISTHSYETELSNLNPTGSATVELEYTITMSDSTTYSNNDSLPDGMSVSTTYSWGGNYPYDPTGFGYSLDSSTGTITYSSGTIVTEELWAYVNADLCVSYNGSSKTATAQIEYPSTSALKLTFSGTTVPDDVTMQVLYNEENQGLKYFYLTTSSGTQLSSSSTFSVENGEYSLNYYFSKEILTSKDNSQFSLSASASGYQSDSISWSTAGDLSSDSITLTALELKKEVSLNVIAGDSLSSSATIYYYVDDGTDLDE